MWRVAGSRRVLSGVAAVALATGSSIVAAQADNDTVPTIRPWASASNMKPVKKSKALHACSVENQFVPGCSELKVFSGNAHTAFAENVAKEMGVELGRSTVSRFADGEISVKINESVRGKDVYIVQSVGPPVNEHLMELLLLTSAMRQASAKRVTLVIPYLGYMRSLSQTISATDKHDWNHYRSNLAASDVVEMLEVSGAQRVVAVEMYSEGQGIAEGFFSKASLEHIRSSTAVAPALIETLGLESKAQKDGDLVVVAPHTSTLTRAKGIRQELSKALKREIGLGTIIRTPIPLSKGAEGKKKHALNLSKRTSEVCNNQTIDLVGNVKGKHVLIADFLIESGRTTASAVKVLKDQGAKSVSVFACHCVFSESAPMRLASSGIETIVTLDTLPGDQDNLLPNLKRVSIAPKVADLITKLHYVAKT